jgi:hypothetical protein
VSVGRYTATAAIVVASSLGAVVLGLRGRLDAADIAALVVGAALALANSVAAYGLVTWSAERSTAWFFRAILGGMLARMTFLLGAVLVGILFLDLPRLPLVFSLLGYFVALLVFEVAVVARLVSQPARRVEAT